MASFFTLHFLMYCFPLWNFRMQTPEILLIVEFSVIALIGHIV